MSTFWPIFKREYMTRIRSKGFWISTALFPILTLVVTVVPSRLAMKSKGEATPVRVVDAVGDFFPVLEGIVAEADRPADSPPLVLERPAGRRLEAIGEELNALSESGQIQGYVIIDRTSIEEGKVLLLARSPSTALAGDYLPGIFAQAIRRYRLDRLGLAGKQIEDAVGPIDFDVEKATSDPKKKQSGMSALYMSIGMVMFIYFALLFYGVYVLRGVLEEKSNRIVEVIVSTVRPFDLMLGKILGIGSVGLTQIAIWATTALLATSPQIAALMSISSENRLKLDPAMLIFFPVYFVLGYFMFATIYAGIGSMFNSEEDAQQLVSVATMLLVVPMIVMTPVIKNPSGTLAVVLSLIPFFSPILMYLRIAVQMPPMWQIALSIVIMIATTAFLTWIVAKIYRVGILMYGKKPTIPELVRWLRYS